MGEYGRIYDWTWRSEEAGRPVGMMDGQGRKAEMEKESERSWNDTVLPSLLNEKL